MRRQLYVMDWSDAILKAQELEGYWLNAYRKPQQVEKDDYPRTMRDGKLSRHQLMNRASWSMGNNALQCYRAKRMNH